MKILKYVLNLILAFLLIIAIVGIIAVNLLSEKILNKEYMISKLEETEFYLQVSREVQSGFENYIYQSGLPEDIIKDLYTEETIKSDIDSIFDYVYDGTDIKISNEIVEETLDNRINEYLKEQNKNINEQGKQNIKKFEELIVNEYINNVNVSSYSYETLHKAIEKMNTVYEKVKNIPFIITLVLVILIVIINIKDLLIGINFASISLLSSGVVLNLAQKIIFENVDIDNIVVFSTSLSNLLISIIKDILYTINNFGNYFIVAGITGIIIAPILKNINKKDNSKKEKKVH